MKLFIALLVIFITACTPTSLELFAPANYAESLLNFEAEEKIHIEIEPQGQSAQVFYSLNYRDLAAGIALRPVIHVHGWAKDAQEYLKLDEQTKHDNMPRFSDILALPRANNIHFLSPRMPVFPTGLSSDQSFKLDLLAGLSYSLVLNPNGLHERAPLYLNLEQMPDENNLIFNLGEFGQFITGQIRYIGAKKDLWQVRIVQGNRLVSSVAQVKKNGHFLVELSKLLFLGNDALITIIIEPCELESALPRFTKNFTLSELLDKPDLGPIDLGRLAKPAVAKINIPGPGFIYLRGDVGLGKVGEVRIKKAINEAGPTIFDNLYEGTYDIALEPPAESPWGMRVLEQVDILGPTFDMNIKWPKRQVLNAQVINDRNKVVTGAQIVFSRDNAEKIFSDLHFSFTAPTNDQGRVCQRQFGVSIEENSQCEGLALDDGRYVAHVIPPPGSRYAHGWQTFDFPLTQKLELKLVETQMLTGKIFAADQITPIKQAYITIYAGDSNLYEQPKILANAITDASGSFRAFVPAPQKSH